MFKIFIVSFCIVFLSCSSNRTSEESMGSGSDKVDVWIEAPNGTTSDTCSFCLMEPFLVEQVDQDIKTKIIIDYPVAIELMDRVAWINLYENDKGYDTLMKLLKMKNHWDRNVIYDHYGIRGYYADGIRPILIDNHVTIIDTIKQEHFVTIKDEGEIYVIDLNRYRKDDGVLMFTPGKKPIYWTMQKEQENCFSYFGFSKWYYNCR